MTDWLKERITERTSIDGLILVGVGVLALIAKPIIGLLVVVGIALLAGKKKEPKATTTNKKKNGKK